MSLVIHIMNIPIQGPRQVFLYNHGCHHWSQGGPIFYDRRLNQQVAIPPIGTQFQNNQFAGHWFRGPVITPGPQNPPHFHNFRVNITWNAPFHNNLNIHFGRNFVNRVQFQSGMIGGRPVPRPLLGSFDLNEEADVCFICGDFLQNSNERGVHLCDGGNRNHSGMPRENGEAPRHLEENSSDSIIKSKLDMVLQNIQATLKNDCHTVSETLEKYFTDRISEISTIHREVVTSREALAKLRLELEAKAADLEQKEKKMLESQNRLSRDKDKLVEDGKKERAEIARQWQILRDEIVRMEELHEVQKGRIKLDVGGHVYTTSLLTLTRDSESMLAAMFSGRHEIKIEGDGTVFIDRDGTHFRYILNYLRDGGFTVESLPRSRQVLRELRNEAVYFQLHGLVQQIEKFL